MIQTTQPDQHQSGTLKLTLPRHNLGSWIEDQGDGTRSVALVWDRHPIHKRKMVQEFLASHKRLHMFCFPVAASNSIQPHSSGPRPPNTPREPLRTTVGNCSSMFPMQLLELVLLKNVCVLAYSALTLIGSTE